MDNQIEQKILELFLYNDALKFNEIEKQVKIRSNKLSYHIKNLLKKGILVKNKENYSLSPTAETILPYLSDKRSVLPVILIHIGNNKKAFLYLREKRPFKGYYSLPGGRLLVNESISDSVIRIMKKYDIKAKLSNIHSISLEHVKNKGSGSKIHSFLLIFVSAKISTDLKLLNLDKNKSKIIKSDFQLLKNDLNKDLKINTLYSTS